MNKLNKGILLCFLYTFPPKNGSAALRNQNNVVELAQHFRDCIILTNAPIDNNNLHLPTNCTMIYISSFDYRSILTNRTKSGIKETIKNNLISQFFIKLINTLPINLLFGEGGGYYLVKSILKAKNLARQKDITHIYSSFRPITDHITAFVLKKNSLNYFGLLISET